MDVPACGCEVEVSREGHQCVSSMCKMGNLGCIIYHFLVIFGFNLFPRFGNIPQ